MTKKQKRIVMYLAAFLVALALISICLVGNTFARFVSNGTGTASVTVAKWSLTDGNDNSPAVGLTVTGLSPNKSEYTGTLGSSVTANTSANDTYGYRYKSTAETAIATIKNEGAVSALVTLSGTTEVSSLTYVTGNKVVVDSDNIYYDNDNDGEYDNPGDTSTGYTETTIKGLFTLVLSSFTGIADNANTSLAGGYFTIAPNETLIIYGYVVWTSDDGTVYGDAADLRDTFVGEYVTGVTWSLSYSAVQASELPA